MVQERAQSVSAVARESMLRMAGTWESLGQINQAVDFYLRIIRRHPGSREAEESRDRLLGLAGSFERTGRFRLAMDLYERTEHACRG